MDGGDQQDPQRKAVVEPRAVTDEVIAALVRLAQADFSVRLPRNFQRDTEDVLAMFVNLIAEELARLTEERERSHRQLEDGMNQLSEAFLAFAAGDFSARVARSNTGDPLDVLAFLFNNTAAEVEESFEEVERQHAVLEAILDSMLDGVLRLDPAGNVLRANAAMGRLLGRTVEQLVGRNLEDLVAQRGRDVLERLSHIRQEGAFTGVEVLFSNERGQVSPLSVNVSPHVDAQGVLTGIVLVARDDRELKETQARLQLADRLAVMGTVAAGVAHEINNPLAFMISNLDFVSEELTDLDAEITSKDRLAEVVNALVASRGGAERVRLIVRDLKAYSRVEQDAEGVVEMPRLIDTALSMIRNEVRYRARVVKEIGPCPAVDGNEARLLQVFLNLIQNAAHAIPRGNIELNTIRVVTATAADGRALFEVHDTGSGISDDHRSHIFDAFFTTKPAGLGTGLGLAICHKIVSGMRGTIEVESEVGKGSTFRVLLPPTTRASVPREASDEARQPHDRRRVLVVDDESEVGHSVDRILGRQHTVVTVTRAQTALDLLEREEFDLVLCDLMMPGMSGIELFLRVQARDPAMGARFIFMTAGTFDSAAEDFLRGIANPRLDKPFDVDVLRELVGRGVVGNRALDSAPPRPSP